MSATQTTSNIEALREQLRYYVEHAGEKSLRMMGAIFEIEEDQIASKLPPHAQESLARALAESEAGMGRPIQEIKNKIAAWRSK